MTAASRTSPTRPDTFVEAIRAALSEPAAPRQALADTHLASQTWDQIWARVADRLRAAIIDRRLKADPVAIPPESGLAGSNTFKRTKMFDYLVVGAGFAGAVVAERLADAGRKVLIVDKRMHIGGNAYDCHDSAGILVHRYGPHIFHTNSRDVFDYLGRFTAWRPYQHRVRACVDGQLLPIPINLNTVNELYGTNLTSFELEQFLASVAEPRIPIRTAEDVVVGKVGRELYNKFFRNYTRKQWDLDPSELDPTVTGRVPFRTSRDDRYFTDTYQAMPRDGYAKMFERMLKHPYIRVLLNTPLPGDRGGHSLCGDGLYRTDR